MRPGISSIFINPSPETAVRLFGEKQWFELELSFEHAAALLERGDPKTVGAEFREFAAGYGVSFPQGHLWLLADICKDEHVKRLYDWLDLFDGIGIRAAVLHCGGNDILAEGGTQRDVIEANIAPLKELCAYIEDSGMTICLENLRARTNKIEHLLEIIDIVGSPGLGICLDTGHLNIAKGDQYEFITKAGDRLKALHIHDNNGADDEHIFPYGNTGTVDFKNAVRALKEINYTGLFNYEVGGGYQKCSTELALIKLDYLKDMHKIMTGQD